jgi:hypothetical protein
MLLDPLMRQVRADAPVVTAASVRRGDKIAHARDLNSGRRSMGDVSCGSLRTLFEAGSRCLPMLEQAQPRKFDPAEPWALVFEAPVLVCGYQPLSKIRKHLMRQLSILAAASAFVLVPAAFTHSFAQSANTQPPQSNINGGGNAGGGGGATTAGGATVGANAGAASGGGSASGSSGGAGSGNK